MDGESRHSFGTQVLDGVLCRQETGTPHLMRIGLAVSGRKEQSVAFTLEPDAVPRTGVYARIEDAGVLADAGRVEGALLMLLVAVAATARKRYPVGTPSAKWPKRKMSDREAFTLFLRDEMWRLVKEHSDVVLFRGRKRPIEEFLYEFLRCELVHNVTVSADLQPLRDEDLLTFDLPDGSRVGFSKLLLARLNDVIWRSPENSFGATRPEMAGLSKRAPNPAMRRTRKRAPRR
jgi:hypothetical protein